MKLSSSQATSLQNRSDLEALVDELIKYSPNEETVRVQMHAAGLNYLKDPVLRLNLVLEVIEGAKPATHGGLQARTSKIRNQGRARDHVQDL